MGTAETLFGFASGTEGGETPDIAVAGLVPGLAGIDLLQTTIPADLPDGDQRVVVQMN